MTLPSYQPSGRFSVSLYPRALLAIAGSVLIARGYESLLFATENMYAVGFFVLLFGLLLGFLSLWVTMSAKSRSAPISLLTALVIGLTGLIASYLSNYLRFVDAIAQDNPQWARAEIAKSALSPWLDARIEHGWVIGTVTRTGAFVVSMWIAEAIVVLGFALLPVWKTKVEPICEACEVWTKTQSVGLPGIDRSQVELLLAKNDLGTLISVEGIAQVETASSQVVLTRAYCPQCKDSGFLSVSEIVYSRNAEGGLHEERRVMAELLVLSAELNRRFAARIERRDHPGGV